jgi:hypothetical protein
MHSTPVARITTVPKVTTVGSQAMETPAPTSMQPIVPPAAEHVEAGDLPSTGTASLEPPGLTSTALRVLATTAEPTATPLVSVFDAGSDTATPTATSRPGPTATASPEPTFTPAPTVPGATATPASSLPSATPTETPEEEDEREPTRYPPTPTPTSIPGDLPVGWSFSNVTGTLGAGASSLLLWGQVFNNTGADQYLLTTAARVYDGQGTLLADDYNTVGVVPVTTLVQGRKAPFGLEIYLPEREFDPDQLSYELYVEAMDAWYETREDLAVLEHTWTVTDGHYEITGTVQNRGPALTSFVKVIATLYDAGGKVVGLGWFSEVDPSYLAPGVVEFTIQVENVPFEAVSYDLQALGR